MRAFFRRVVPLARGAGRRIAAYFREQPPKFGVAFAAALVVAAFLYTRSPSSNYIFDEQEALLANPYVNGDHLGFFDVLDRDFWGLPPERSIGSYRPIPNVIWRALWQLGAVFRHPWIHHWVNVVLHAVNAALVARIAWSWTRDRAAGWLAGASFVTSAVLTEAVAGVVGIADVLGGLGLLLALRALSLPLGLAPFGVFAAVTFGLFSKESTLVAIPVVGWAALLTAPLSFPERPRRLLRTLGAVAGATLALVLYTEVRRAHFPAPVRAELSRNLPVGAAWYERALHAFLKWFAQPRLPADPINNPLIDADTAHRIAGALRVYAEGVLQVLFPFHLSGDYSFRAEPVPERVVTVVSVAGALLLIAPPVVALALWIAALVRERRERRASGGFETPSSTLGRRITVAVSLVWFVVAYFPHSNIPVLLPTVRAERFWYLPVAGMALTIGVAASWLLRAGSSRFAARLAALAVTAFFTFQAARARWHALDYSDDLTFWRATANAEPMSAKAHLNYGVMLGARGRLQERLVENGRALELAPQWPMAHVYYADTLCRLDRVEEAWPHYKRGFSLAPNDRNLIALGLQCLWDKKAIEARRLELIRLADKHVGSWLAYLARDIVYHGKEHGGVEPKYRPRSYDEGPKQR